MDREFQRRRLLIRIVAGFMLTIFFPAAVIAAPLRHCKDHIGYRAIDFAHASDGFRPNRQVVSRAFLLEATHRALHVLSPHCVDKLLLPVAAKAEKRYLWVPNHDAVLRSDIRLHHTALARRRASNRLLIAATRLRDTDPRLRTRRTVVLLN